MKKLASLMIILGPMAGWAQSGSPPAHPEGAPAREEAPAAPAYPNAAEKFTSPIEQVRVRLGLTTDQQALWHAYESKVEAYAGLFYREKPVLASQNDTAARQIGRLVDKLQNRLAALEEVERAANTLYVSLNPAQQKTANTLLLATIPSLDSSGMDPSYPSKEASRSRDGKEGGPRTRHTGAPGAGNF